MRPRNRIDHYLGTIVLAAIVGTIVVACVAVSYAALEWAFA